MEQTISSIPTASVSKQLGKDFTFNIVIIIAFLKSISCNIMGTGLPNYIIYDLGESSFLAGLATTMYCIPYMISIILFSNLSDKWGRRKCLGIGTIGSGITYIGYLFNFNLYTAYVLRALDGIFTSLIWPNLIASISDIKGIDNAHEKRISRYNVSWSSGSVLGVVFGAIAVYLLESNRITCTIGAISNFLLIFAFFFLKLPSKQRLIEIHQEIKDTALVNEKSNNESLNNSNNTRKQENILANFSLMIPILIIFVHATTLGGFQILVTSKLESYGIASYIIFFLVFCRVFASTIISPKTSKIKELSIGKIVLVSALLFAICMIIFSYTINVFLYIILFLIMGFAAMYLYTSALKIMMEKNSAENTGKYGNWFEIMIGIGFGIGPVLAGWGADYDYNITFIYFAVVIVSLGLFIYWLFRKNAIKIQ